MMLKNKVAVIYGAGGSIGGAVARAFASEGAKLFLTGRHRALVETVAKEIVSVGGSADGNDFLGDGFDECPVASREKKLGPLARKGACDSTADRASGSVDHRNFVLQHH